MGRIRRTNRKGRTRKTADGKKQQMAENKDTGKSQSAVITHYMANGTGAMPSHRRLIKSTDYNP